MRLVRQLADLADAAMGGGDLQCFGRQALGVVNAVVGHDGAALVFARAGRGFEAVTETYDANLLQQRGWDYMLSMHPREVALHTQCTRQDDEIFTSVRQRQLALYEEVVRPVGTKSFIVRGHVAHDWLFAISVGRMGRVRGQFVAREKALLDVIFPIALAGAHAVQSGRPRLTEEDWRGRFALTRREAEIAGYVLRGLENKEIASLLGVSGNTVRNQLASAMTKVNVSNRTELTFALLQTSEAPSAPPRDHLSVFNTYRREGSTTRRK